MTNDADRYRAAAHAMQSGVRLRMTREGVPDDSELIPGHTSPKHLRVGINSAMSDQGGLARLLIEKGLITEAEYVKAMADAMEAEAQSYHDQLGLGDNVTLG